MAKQYDVTPSTLRVNRFTSWLARRGIGRTQVLTTVGNRTGGQRSVPVSPVQIDGDEFLVSPYGEVGWVRNVRVNPLVTLRHGSSEREVRLEEVTGPVGAPAVAAYHAREGFARPFMNVPDNPELDDFVRVAEQFPVFRVATRS